MDGDGSNRRSIYFREQLYAAAPFGLLDGSAMYFNLDLSSGGGIYIVRLDIYSRQRRRD